MILLPSDSGVKHCTYSLPYLTPRQITLDYITSLYDYITIHERSQLWIEMILSTGLYVGFDLHLVRTWRLLVSWQRFRAMVDWPDKYSP